MSSDPTTPTPAELDLEAVKARYADFHKAILADGAMRDAWPAIQSADDVPLLLAALSDVERRVEVAEQRATEAEAALGRQTVEFDRVANAWSRTGSLNMKLTDENAALRSTVERMTKVIEGAKAWRELWGDATAPVSTPERALVAAVDTYEANTGGTE